MKTYLSLLIPLQRLFLPGLILLVVWAVWRTIWHRDLPVGLALYIGLVTIVDGFLNTGIYIPGLDQGSIHYSELCAVFLVFNRPDVSTTLRERRTIVGLIAVYFLLLFISALRTDSMVAGIFDFRVIIVPQIVAFWVAARGFEGPQAYKRFLLCLIAVVLIVGLFDFWDLFLDRWILKSDMLDKPIYYHNRELNRFGSIFLNPNYFGAFIVLLFPPAFVLTLNQRSAWLRLYTWAGVVTLVFCLVETQSRGPMLAFAIGLVLLTIGPCGETSRRRRVSFLVLGTIVVALFMPGFFQHAVARFDDLERDATEEGRSRQTTWRYTGRIIADYPVLGIGMGETQFMKFMRLYGFEDEYNAETLDAPHNSYLQIATYAGIPALLVFLLANGILLIAAVRTCLRSDDSAVIPTVFGIAVGISAFLATVSTDLQLFTQNVAPVYWILFGLLLSLTMKAPAINVAAPTAAFTPRLGVWRGSAGYGSMPRPLS